MQIHYSMPERQLNNVTEEYSCPDTEFLPYYDVRLVLDIVSVNAGAVLDGVITAEKDGAVLCTAPIHINAVGQCHVGCTYGGATGVIYRGSFTLTGRMRLSARVVSFAQGEDCPEVI